MSIFVVTIIYTGLCAFLMGFTLSLIGRVDRLKIDIECARQELEEGKKELDEVVSKLNNVHNHQVESMNTLGQKVHDLDLRMRGINAQKENKWV